MCKVLVFNSAKDSKGVSKYKINRLFMLYFTMKFLFFGLISYYVEYIFIELLQYL
ncbi:hypothetical protein BSF42_38380 [Flavobacterium sp. ACN6]|nr:hypothetical protein BSF42_38380 [Flavobacterium sp. ACN6]